MTSESQSLSINNFNPFIRTVCGDLGGHILSFLELADQKKFAKISLDCWYVAPRLIADTMKIGKATFANTSFYTFRDPNPAHPKLPPQMAHSATLLKVTRVDFTDNTNISNEEFTSNIQLFPNVGHLTLMDREALEDNSFDIIANLQKLKTLEMDHLDSLTIERLNLVVRRQLGLEKLSFCVWDFLEGGGLEKMGVHNELREIRGNLRKSDVIAIGKYCPQLEVLDRLVDSATKNVLKALKKLPFLTTLSFQNGYINKAKLQNLVSQHPKLISLNLREVWNLKANSFNCLINLKELEYLNLSFTYVNDETVLNILENCTQLKILDISKCDISPETLATIATKHPKLKIVLESEE